MPWVRTRKALSDSLASILTQIVCFREEQPCARIMSDKLSIFDESRLTLWLLTSLILLAALSPQQAQADTPRTNGPPAAPENLFVSVYGTQHHFTYLDKAGNVQDAWWDNKWNLQKINNGGCTPGPAAAGNLFVSVYNNQHHITYLDGAGNIQDAWLDNKDNKWNLQKINNGGCTPGPAAAGNLFVSVYNNQHHFTYLDKAGNIQDAWLDNKDNKWNLQKINNGGCTPGPAAAGNLFVSVYNNQHHFTYVDGAGNIQDAWYDNKWNLQKINNGGCTPGPAAAGNLFVSVYNNTQHHFTYVDGAGNIQDAWWDNKWNLQKINNGGCTPGPAAAGNLFVSVYNNQHHFTYLDGAGNIQDAWYDNKWNLQKLNNGGRTPGLPVAGHLFVSVYNNQHHFAYIDYRGVVQDAWYANGWNLEQLTTEGGVTGSVPIDAVVVSIMYAPPGSSGMGAKCSVTYGDTSTLGTSSSLSHSFKVGGSSCVSGGYSKMHEGRV